MLVTLETRVTHTQSATNGSIVTFWLGVSSISECHNTHLCHWVSLGAVCFRVGSVTTWVGNAYKIQWTDLCKTKACPKTKNHTLNEVTYPLFPSFIYPPSTPHSHTSSTPSHCPVDYLLIGLQPFSPLRAKLICLQTIIRVPTTLMSLSTPAAPMKNDHRQLHDTLKTGEAARVVLSSRRILPQLSAATVWLTIRLAKHIAKTPLTLRAVVNLRVVRAFDFFCLWKGQTKRLLFITNRLTFHLTCWPGQHSFFFYHVRQSQREAAPMQNACDTSLLQQAQAALVLLISL